MKCSRGSEQNQRNSLSSELLERFRAPGSEFLAVTGNREIYILLTYQRDFMINGSFGRGRTALFKDKLMYLQSLVKTRGGPKKAL